MKQSKNKNKKRNNKNKNKTLKKYYGGKLLRRLINLASNCHSSEEITNLFSKLMESYNNDRNKVLDIINATTEKGYNALRIAYENDCFDNFITLLGLGAIDVYDIRRHTVLLKSIADRRINYIDALLDHPASITVNNQTLQLANHIFPNENMYAEPLTPGARIIKSLYLILVSQGDITLPTAHAAHAVETEPYNDVIRTNIPYSESEVDLAPPGETPQQRELRYADAVGLYDMSFEDPVAINEAMDTMDRPEGMLVHLFGNQAEALPITHIDDQNVSVVETQKTKRFGGRKSRKIRKSKKI